jgi:glucose dehydrogenase
VLLSVPRIRPGIKGETTNEKGIDDSGGDAGGHDHRPASAQNNWTNFGQDPGATNFSTLDQINVDNVTNLKRAWTFPHGRTTPASSRADCSWWTA